MSTPACPADLVAFGHRLADAAAAVHRRHFRRPVGVRFKDDGTPVTRADQEAESVMRELIRGEYPDHGILGEEYPPEQADAELVWVLDPLDGTRLFLSGMPTFGVLVALARQGRFVLGLIEHPVLGERWVGADGHGTQLNGRTVRCRACPRLEDAVMARPGVGDHTLGRDDAIGRAAAGARWVHWGVSCYDYGLVAGGFLDLVVTAGPRLHDLAPLDPVLRNAGGIACGWDGSPLTLTSRDLVIAAGDPALVADLVPLLG